MSWIIPDVCCLKEVKSISQKRLVQWNYKCMCGNNKPWGPLVASVIFKELLDVFCLGWVVQLASWLCLNSQKGFIHELTCLFASSWHSIFSFFLTTSVYMYVCIYLYLYQIYLCQNEFHCEMPSWMELWLGFRAWQDLNPIISTVMTGYALSWGSKQLCSSSLWYRGTN